MRVDMRRTGPAAGVALSGGATRSVRHRRRALVAMSALVALVGLVAATPALAQSGDGYLFGAPKGSVTLRGGFAQARASSDVFQEATQQLTLSKRDFAGFSGGLEAAARVGPNLDLSLDVDYMSTSAPSHYRGLVDLQNQEIEQTTSLRRVPMTINAKVYLAPPGRSVGRFAWIPSTLAPYVGVGGGVMAYRFAEEGDFVDLSTNAVRPDRFVSDGTTPMAQVMAGADYTLSPRLAITGDARYLLVKGATLGRDFSGYQPLDLSGVALSLGLTVRL
jgi:outer membrane protein W